MIPHRLQVKYFVDDPASVDKTAFVPVFHRWIQDKVTEELLIDIHNYTHVHEGPGILLVGHEADYSLDFADGRPGLVYRRKRAHGDSLREVLSNAFRQALAGARRLEEEKLLEGITFGGGEAVVSFLDRLRLPNEAASFEEVRADLEAVLAPLYEDAGLQIERLENDPREPLTVRVLAPEAPAVGTLLERLEKQYA